VSNVKKYKNLLNYFDKDCLIREMCGIKENEFDYDKPNPGDRMFYYREDGTRF